MDDMEQIYQAHARTVYKFLLSQCHDADLAEELTQETFYQAVRSIDRFNGSCKVSVWLCQIAKHLWYQHLRKRKPEEPLPEDGLQGRFAGAKEDQPEEIAIAREQAEMVRRAVEALDDAHRVPLYLYYTAELPIEEIASLLKLPKGTVKSRLYHARKAILKRLEAADHE